MKKKALSKNRELIINLISSIVVFGVNLIINFCLSPYIVKSLGVEANGFVTLANNFVSYASLATLALNSMAGRFITIKVHQNDIEGANRYYTTVTLGNFFLALVMLIPSIFCVVYLERIIDIPPNLLWDVKLLFAFIFVNFLLSTAFSSWSTATFVTNKLYLQSLRTMQSQLYRVIVIIGLFVILQPSVYYMGVAALIATIFTTLYSLYYKKKLLPEVHIKRKDFDIASLWELISSGIWNTVIKAGQLLLSGLDLLISNLFIGSTEMGMLALAKTLPNVITHLGGTITAVFTPTLTINYAKGDLIGVKNELKKGMKITGVLLTIPLSIMIIFGKEFYQLWVPSQDARILQVLSVLTCISLIFTSGIQCLYNIFTVVNKLKVYSMLILLSGVASTIVVFVLLKTTGLGIYAVAGVSSFVNLTRNVCFAVPFGAKYLKLKWHTFYPEVAYSALSVVLSVLIGYGVKQFFVIDSWFMLALEGGLTALLGFFVNIFIVLNKNERKHLLKILTKKIKKANS